MNRLGVLGGSFNPVHWGHLHVALLAREAAGLDRVIFVPAAMPPHKPAWELAPAADRLEMLALALGEEPESAVSDAETRPGGTRYTVDTLDRLREEHPGTEIRFILGMDSLAELPTWREPDRLVREYGLVAVNRPGLEPVSLDPRWTGSVIVVDGNPFAISSSGIRRRVAAGRSIRHLVPEGVASYIRERGLYRREAVPPVAGGEKRR